MLEQISIFQFQIITMQERVSTLRSSHLPGTFKFPRLEVPTLRGSHAPNFGRSRNFKFQCTHKGATIRFPGGGAGVFVAGKFFISTGLGGALTISYFVTCLYGTVLEVNYLFHAESARNYLFKKYSCPPPPWESNGGPLSR